MKISISIVLYGKKEYFDVFKLWLESTKSFFAEIDISINLAISTAYSSFVTNQLKTEFNISRVIEFEEKYSPHHSINMLYRYLFLAEISSNELMLFRDVDALFLDEELKDSINCALRVSSFSPWSSLHSHPHHTYLLMGGLCAFYACSENYFHRSLKTAQEIEKLLKVGIILRPDVHKKALFMGIDQYILNHCPIIVSSGESLFLFISSVIESLRIRALNCNYGNKYLLNSQHSASSSATAVKRLKFFLIFSINFFGSIRDKFRCKKFI